MAIGKNCPNCGAVYEVEKNKCPYCGTSYFDMSAIDFTTNEPIYLKIRITLNGREVFLTQKVRPRLGRIEITSNCTDYRGYKGNVKLYKCINETSLLTNIEFEAMSMDENKLLILEVEE